MQNTPEEQSGETTPGTILVRGNAEEGQSDIEIYTWPDSWLEQSTPPAQTSQVSRWSIGRLFSR